MGKREIKKSVVHYQHQNVQGPAPQERERSRSREKEKADKGQVAVEQVDVSSRRARLLAMRKTRRQQEDEVEQMLLTPQEVQVKLQDLPKSLDANKSNLVPVEEEKQPEQHRQPQIKHASKPKIEQEDSSNSEDQNRPTVLSKPVFIRQELRTNDAEEEEKARQAERKKKSIRYNTKMLLEQSKYADSEEENQNTDSEQENRTDIPDDDDEKEEEYEFELWKIRELKRIRRDQEQRRKHQMEKAELQRRRNMTNEQILIQNKQLGSDATDNQSETKYVFMQKYYSKGAFYQDSEDPIFQRDYNMPTPLEMVDKSMLPKILQKRIGNFGKKGQSKYTHLTNEDTSDLNPLTRPDESLLDYWKKRTAGYKSGGSKV